MRDFILGSDWWTDCDDAVALRILARAVKSGKINLLGIGINACMEYSAASIKAYLKNEKLDFVPVGIDLEATDFGGKPPYQKRLSETCTPYVKNEDLEDAASLYIRLLKNAENKVEIIEIGYPQVLDKVLEKEPELFYEKVEKVWMMAGKWDEPLGKENNFARNERSRKAAAHFCENCKVPVVFLGWEVSFDILTGGELAKDDVLYRILCDHGSENGRSSWDPMLVQLAVTGNIGKAGYTAVYGKASVNAETGENTFAEEKGDLHCYVKKIYPNDYYKNSINEIIKSV